jgi:cytochrome c oxidase subunit I
VMAAVAVLSGKASVLYTFYPPLLASPWYYGGAFLLIGGSMIWVALMVINMASWKRDHPGKPVPLAMFAITATAILWAWAASGVLIELLGVLLPRAFGLTNLIDAGLGRTLFSVTLHGIVYFLLMPAYIAFYTMLPQAAGGGFIATRWAVSLSSCSLSSRCRLACITFWPTRSMAWASNSCSRS